MKFGLRWRRLDEDDFLIWVVLVHSKVMQVAIVVTASREKNLLALINAIEVGEVPYEVRLISRVTKSAISRWNSWLTPYF